MAKGKNTKINEPVATLGAEAVKAQALADEATRKAEKEAEEAELARLEAEKAQQEADLLAAAPEAKESELAPAVLAVLALNEEKEYAYLTKFGGICWEGPMIQFLDNLRKIKNPYFKTLD